MAARYWVGTTTSWNTSANWSATSGGAGGAGVPTSADDAILDSNGTSDCDVDYSFAACKTLTIASGYTGTLDITTGNSLLVIGNYTDNTSGSLISTGTGELKLVPASYGTQTIIATLIDAKITFFAGANRHSITIIFASSMTIGGNIVVNSQYSGPAPNVFDLATYNIDLTLRGGLSHTGAYTSTMFSWSKGTGTITAAGTADQDWDFNGESVEDIDIDKTSGTVSLTGIVTTDSFTLTSGTFDANANTLTTTGNFTQAAGTTVLDTGGA